MSVNSTPLSGVRVRGGNPGVKWVLTVLLVAASIILVYQPIKGLTSAGRSDYYSHIFLIPFVSAYFFFIERKGVAGEAGRLEGWKIGRMEGWKGYSWNVGIPLIAAGLLAYGIAIWQRAWLGTNDLASLTTTASIVIFWGGFVLIYGLQSFGANRFPLLFLLFTIPVPICLLDRFIYVLQVGSTQMTQWLFDLTGTTYFRDGFAFQLSGINIEVAKECSGIRSTLALIISCVVAGHLFLKSGPRQLLLLIAILPITVFKNGVRILTLSLLAIYVDTKFITNSWLHHSGGIVFYIPALGLLGLVLWWLRKGEREGKEKRNVGMME